MVRDINPIPPYSTSPTDIVAIGSTAYFTIDDGRHGN